MRLAALVCLGLLPTMGLILFTAFANRRAATEKGKAAALEKATAVAALQSDVFEEKALALRLLAKTPSLRGEDDAAAVEALSELLRTDPAYLNLAVAREDGSVHRSVLPVPEGVRVSERGWFQRAIAGSEFAFSTWQVDRITGRPVVNVAVPMPGPGGARRVLFASLDLPVLFERVGRVELPERAELLVLDRGGAVLARKPHDAALVGKATPGSAIAQEMIAGATGRLAAADVTGIDRLYGFLPVRRAEGEPLAYVAVGFSADAVAAAANEALFHTLLWVAVLTIAAIVAAFVFAGPLVAKPINRLTDMAERIRVSEDLSLRAGPPYSPGEVGRLEAAFDEMTEARRAQEDRRRSIEADLDSQRALFRQMSEVVEAVFWVTEPGEKPFRYVSPAFETIWGFPPERLYEEPDLWKKSIHPSDRARVEESIRRHEEAGRYEETYRIVRPDGTVRWIEDRAFPMRDDAGKILRIYGLAEDATKWKDLEVQFQQAQKLEAVGRLAAGVAHDFNNLLTVIQGYGQVTQSEVSGSTRANVEEILKAAEHAAALTRQLLTFGRRQVIAPEAIDLNHLLQDVGKMVRRLVGPGIEVVELPGSRLGAVHADPNQVRQIVMNLVVNARDAMPGGGRLTIETYNVVVDQTYAQGHLHSKPGPYVVLAVSDTGIGMDDATRSRLFEPFFTTKAEGKGTGLGLATVYGIVKQSGGDIFVYSEKGQGSTFKIYFPQIAAGARGAADARTAAPAATGPKTILLVEDDRAIRTLAYRSLTAAGHTVLVGASAEEGLKELDGFNGTIEVLVTDLALPGMDGFELAAVVRKRVPGVKVLVVSGYTESVAVQGGRLPDGIAYLPKPFGPVDLQRKVAEVAAGVPAPRAS